MVEEHEPAASPGDTPRESAAVVPLHAPGRPGRPAAPRTPTPSPGVASAVASVTSGAGTPVLPAVAPTAAAPLAPALVGVLDDGPALDDEDRDQLTPGGEGPHAPTPAFRVLTVLMVAGALASLWYVGTLPWAPTTPLWHLVGIFVLYVLAVAAPERSQRIVSGRLGDVPDILVGVPLLVLAPFPGLAAGAALLAFVMSRRIDVGAWSTAFNTAQVVVASAAAYLIVDRFAPSMRTELTLAGVGVVVAAAVVRELLGEVLAIVGCRLDGIRVPFDGVDVLRRHASNAVALAVAIGVVGLAHLGPVGAAMSLALLVATVANGEVSAREANQRWLAEAVSVSGERIRAADSYDQVLDRLAEEVARLWQATRWTVSPSTVTPEADRRLRHVAVLPLVRGYEIVLHHPPLGVDAGQMRSTTQTLVRMADERERVLRFQRRLELQASRDDLTGLGNRTRLWEMLDAALPEATATRRLAAVYVDVDRFKSVNDTYGHVVGDSLLRMVAARLVEFAGGPEMPVRLSGDEFVLVVHDADADEPLTQWAQELREHLSRPFDIDGSIVNVSFCLGVAVADHPMDRSALLAATDAAVARAKKTGRGSVVLATSEVVAESRRRLRLESELRTALSMGEFTLHYQPIVDTDAGRVVAVEALIRWMRDGRVWMRPDEFITYAEEMGLISQIGLWVLRRACTQMKEWNEAFRPDDPVAVSVNVSTVHIAQPTFVEDVARILAETGFPPELLIIEITETFALLDLEKSIALGSELKAMGVALWLDDFGTGYSSLEYVRQLPVEVVKLDRSFIVDLGSDATTRTFIESLVALCRSIDRLPMAEGVERPEQRALLAELGCTIQQGYHFARPMPVEELGDYVRRSDESVVASRSA